MRCDAGKSHVLHAELYLKQYFTQFGRDERPLLATITAYARTHLMTISEVTAALSRVAYTLQNCTLVAEQLRSVACAAAADVDSIGWMRLLDWFQESLQVRLLLSCLYST